MRHHGPWPRCRVLLSSGELVWCHQTDLDVVALVLDGEVRVAAAGTGRLDDGAVPHFDVDPPLVAADRENLFVAPVQRGQWFGLAVGGVGGSGLGVGDEVGQRTRAAAPYSQGAAVGNGVSLHDNAGGGDRPWDGP